MKLINSTLAIIVLLAATSSAAYAQKVANYFAGKPGTASYQGYSFWSINNKPAEVTFYKGAARKESKVTYNGKATYNGKSCFKMTLPDKSFFYVYPIGTKLAIVNAASKKIETFSWEYEGPVDGRGTFCQACAQDEKEAITLMKASYLK